MTQPTMEQRGIVSEQSETLPILDNRFLDRYRLVRFKHSRKWFQSHLKDPQDLQLALDALAAYASCERLETVEAEAIRPICQAAVSSRQVIRETAVNMLTLIVPHFAIAGEALQDLLAHPNAKIRFTVITHVPIVNMDLPVAFLREFLRRALKDRSAKNREFAADRIRSCYRADLLPEVRAAIDVEKNKKNLQALRDLVPFLEKGYYFYDNAFSKRSHEVLFRVMLADGTLAEKYIPIGKGMTPAQLEALAQQMKSEARMPANASDWRLTTDGSWRGTGVPPKDA